MHNSVRLKVKIDANERRHSTFSSALCELRGGAAGMDQGGMRMRANVHAVSFQITIQTGASDTENLSGAKAITIAHLQNLQDLEFPDLI